MNKYNITLLQAISIHKTPKTFIMFNAFNNRITSFKFSDDNKEYFSKEYKHFRLIDDLKKQINANLKIQ